MADIIERNADYIRSKITEIPKTAIVLGSGLGDMGEKIENPVYIDYGELEGFAVSTAPGHKGRFIVGRLSGKTVICMQGRLHCYEGWELDKVVLPIRVMRALGAENLILTNAAGGVNLDFKPGDIMLITDHINFMGRNPLVGKNDDSVGTRFRICRLHIIRHFVKLPNRAPQKRVPTLKRAYISAASGRRMKHRRKFVHFVYSERTQSVCPPFRR